MFPTRCLAILALAAAATALPATDKPDTEQVTITRDEFLPPMPAPWYNVPFIGDITKLFAPLWKLFPNFEDLGPRIAVDKNKLQVVINVQDYKMDDLKVKVKRDFILVEGSQETKEHGHDLLASRFSHIYNMPANANGNDVTAKHTTDGYLIVDAPIKESSTKSVAVDRDVPIEETGKPYQEEIPEITTAEPETATEDDRKEPTTPSDQQDATEKDNVIPHGNEVSP